MMTHYRCGLLLGAAILVAAGCAREPEWDTTTQELAQPGTWTPPDDIVALADTYDIANVQAGPWVGPSGCGGGLLEGTGIFREWIMSNWPQVTGVGGYSCRPIANTNSMSVHATGRALDIYIPIDGENSYETNADNDLGDPIANWLLEHAQEVGIQAIIWDRASWTSSRTPGTRLHPYTGTHPHNNHIHMELNPEAAALGTPWFKGPMDPPDFGACGDPIGAEGGVVDDTDPCFMAFGPAKFWRVEGEGIGGTLKWTNAFESDHPSNWARWRLNLAEAGRYRVEYNSVSDWAVYDSAQYRVRHAGAEDDVYVDLSAGEDGWQLLGEFDFEAGDDQWVSLYDNAAGPVPSDQHIIADAIRLVAPGAGPPPQPDPVGGDTLPESPSTNPDPDPGPKTDPFENTEAAEDEGFPMTIHGDGACATTSGSPVDPSALLLTAFLFVRRRP